jgi:hypothetical protein
MVLNADMAMVAMEMPMEMNLLGCPGVEIFDFCSNALIISQNLQDCPIGWTG